MNKSFKKTFEKPRNIFLKPENIFLNELYAFNFNPEGQPKIGRLNSVKDWFHIYEKLLTSLPGAHVKMYIEISSTGRYHFHGYIKIDHITNFYTKAVHELMLNGTSVMKVIESENDWEEYVLKQQSFMQVHLKKEIYGDFIEPSELIGIRNIQF